MTLKELRNSLKQANKGLSYKMYKQSILNALAVHGHPKESPEEANPELYFDRKRYKMPDWMKERYYKQKGVEIVGR